MSIQITDGEEAVAAVGEPPGPMTGSGRSAVTPGLWVVVLLVWLLSLASYSPPGRQAPLGLGQMDWVAIFKVSIRFLALAVLAITFARLPRTSAKRRTVWCLLPFGLYAIWAAVSTIWSPLKALSLGHAGELFMLLALSAVAAVVCVEDKHLSRVLFHLTVVMLLVSLLSVVLSYAANGGIAGMPRPRGFMHPNLAAQSAGGALLIVLAGSLIWKWTWARRLLVPALVIASYLLFSAHSRTAIAATVLAVAVCLFLVGRRRLLLAACVLCIVGVAVYLALDPYGELFTKTLQTTVTYSLRGQTEEQFMSASGRAEMWEIGIRSFIRSPLYGHGNWIMTPTGMAFVWGENHGRTLHNLALHVLTGTGIIGGLLLLWALLRPLNLIRRGLNHASLQRGTAVFALIVVAWFLAIGMYELSFLGPVSPVSVLFFVTLGTVAGRLQ